MSETIYQIIQIMTLPVVVLAVLIAQWKTVRGLNSLHNLVIYYGKQIEALRQSRKVGGGHAREEPGAANSSRGMYEMLLEDDEEPAG